MAKQNMDPAPAAKAGSEEVPKVWVPGKHAMLGGEKIAEAIESEPEGEMIDESDLYTLVGNSSTAVGKSSHHTPPSFFTREVYSELDQLGLAMVPCGHGSSLSYHSVSGQWHGRRDGKNYAPTWGSLRSEKKALLLVLLKLWAWHLEENPEDEEAKEKLNRLQEFNATVDFWKSR